MEPAAFESEDPNRARLSPGPPDAIADRNGVGYFRYGGADREDTCVIRTFGWVGRGKKTIPSLQDLVEAIEAVAAKTPRYLHARIHLGYGDCPRSQGVVAICLGWTAKAILDELPGLQQKAAILGSPEGSEEIGGPDDEPALVPVVLTGWFAVASS